MRLFFQCHVVFYFSFLSRLSVLSLFYPFALFLPFDHSLYTHTEQERGSRLINHIDILTNMRWCVCVCVQVNIMNNNKNITNKNWSIANSSLITPTDFVAISNRLSRQTLLSYNSFSISFLNSYFMSWLSFSPCSSYHLSPIFHTPSLPGSSSWRALHWDKLVL